MGMYGMHGRALHVDLAAGEASALPLDDEELVAVLGGVGLASLLLLRFCPPGADPLGPENTLVFAASPFVGTGITTASKLAVAAKSPQTGVIGDSLSSSYLAIALKRTGYDAVVLTGRAAGPSVLVVDDGAVRLRPASDLLGSDPATASEALRAELGAAFRVAAVGRAAENGVRYAANCNDGRLAGRTGTGAVLWAKGLKAMAVRGSRLPRVAAPARLAAAARDLAARSLGPGTAKYRELGTAANVAFFNRLGLLPTRNFQAGTFAGAGAISGETLLLAHHTDKHACAACTVGCEHHYRTRDAGGHASGHGSGETAIRLEYETLFALGSLCGVADPNTVLRAAALCDRYGMDAISAGGSVAWAMECAEQGIDLGVHVNEVPRFGDGAALLRTLAAIGEGTGIGALLGAGSRRAAASVGQGSEAWAMHVKGLELPGYHPTKLHTLALGLAVGTRGACHNRSSAYEFDLSDRLTPDAEARERAHAAAGAEDGAALLDSLTVCKFLRHVFTDFPTEAAELYGLVTGVPLSGDDLRRTGARIVTLKKLFNIRQGWSRADDTLPPRILDAPEGALDRATLDRLIAAYYAARGWNLDGTIPAEQIAALPWGAASTTEGASAALA